MANNTIPPYDLHTYGAQIARGVIDGASPFGAHGALASPDAINRKIIWPDGTFVIPPSTGLQMSIVSNNAADDINGGSGIKKVHFHYLDINLNEQTAIVELHGLTPVLIDATIRFIQCVHGIEFGSIGTAAVAYGNITVYSGANTYAMISSGESRCTSSARMVPAGKRLMVSSAIGSSTSGTSAARSRIDIVSTYIYGEDYTSAQAFFAYGSLGFQDNSFGITFSPPLSFPEGTVVAMVGTTDKAAEITADWFGWIETESKPTSA